jgi:uncharacterized protein YcbK (DUF882 family)
LLKGDDFMGDLTEHFSEKEFACSCGCGLMNVKGRLLLTLSAVREAVSLPVNIESGCRCEKRNIAVGGEKNSGHLTGEAADIWVNGLSNQELGTFIKRLRKEGSLPYLRYCYLIKGASNTRVHVGVDEKSRGGVFKF